MKITSHLSVSSSLWKYVYNSFLDFLNQELQQAYSHAINFYENSYSVKETAASQQLAAYIYTNNVNQYQATFIKNAVLKNTDKIYKPKKIDFSKLTNRTTYVDTGVFQIYFHKKETSIEFESISFDDLDSFIRDNSLLTEYINMVNTINWPTKPGPVKKNRGAFIATTTNDKDYTVFYKAGPNPALPLSYSDNTMREPAQLRAGFVKNIKLVSFEEASQPVPQMPNSEEF